MTYKAKMSERQVVYNSKVSSAWQKLKIISPSYSYRIGPIPEYKGFFLLAQKMLKTHFRRKLKTLVQAREDCERQSAEKAD